MQTREAARKDRNGAIHANKNGKCELEASLKQNLDVQDAMQK